MKFITLKKASEREIYESKSNAKVIFIAFLCAVSAWFIITMTRYPSEIKELRNIPVIVDTSGTTAGSNNLQVIGSGNYTVNVNFECSRTDYKRLNLGTVEAYVDFSNISSPGKQTFSVKVRSKNGATINSPQIYPPTITLDLDHIITDTVNLSPKHPNLKPADGKTIYSDDVKCEPIEVTIKGPESEIKKIDKTQCYAVYNKEMTLDESTDLISDSIQFLTEDGTPVNQQNFEISPPAVNLRVEVLTLKTVPVQASFNSVSEDFDTKSLKYHFEPSEITIGIPDNTDPPPSIDIPIQLSDLDIGYSKPYPLTDKRLSGTKDIDRKGSVTFVLEDDDLASKEITLTNNNIHLLQVPDNYYDYTIETQKLTVKVIGPKGIINDITASDLQAEVNLIGAENEVINPFQYDVVVSCKTRNNVWAVSTQKVTVNKTQKSAASAQSSTRNT